MKAKAFRFAIISLMLLAYSFYGRAQVSFFHPPTYNGGVPMFVADFNSDGKPDILTSDGTMNLGNGDGTFKQGTSLSNTSVPILAVADFNGDGKPDVLEQGTGTLLVLLGNGDGTFQAPISTPSGAALASVAAADLNGDHKADVVGIWNATLYVYISNGDGTFKGGVAYSPGIPNTNVVLLFGDFNNDQKIDVAVSSPGQEIVLLGNGDGTFQQTNKASAGVNNPQLAVVGDFNGDGKMDLAVELEMPAGLIFNPPPAVYILLGNGDGTFQTPVLAMTGAAPVAVASLGVADLNGDGKLDIVLALPNGAQIYLGNGDGTFTNTANYDLCLPQSPLGSNPGLALADFNSDGKSDIAGCNAVLLGNGNGTFQGSPLVIVPDIPYSPNPAGGLPAVVGQFDKTGAPGVAMVSSNLYIIKNDGSGALSLAHIYPLPQPGSEILTADLNRDGNLDLVVIGIDGSYSILLGNGDGTFQAPVYYPQGNAPISSAVIADFNNDHKPDLAVAGVSNGPLYIFLGNGDGTFASPVPYFDDGLGGPLLVADFNRDGKLDIVAGGVDTSDTRKTLILLGNGDGTFQAAVFLSNLTSISPQFTADVNNDGKPDLISNYGGGTQVALGNGDGTFNLLSPMSCPSWLTQGDSTPLPCWIMAVADLNGDGRPDLVLQQGEYATDYQTGIQLGNGDGTFAPVFPFPPTGNVPLFSIADMNGDGRPDLVFGWEMQVSWASFAAFTEIGVILNTTAPDFSIGPASGSSTSQTVTAGQTASFKLVLGSIESFSGAANLSCAITPPVTPAATCNLSSSSVQISTTASPTVTVNVATMASTTTSARPRVVLPPGAMLTAVILSGLVLLFARGRRRLPALATPAMTIALALCLSCGGGSSHHTTQGTPPGTYAATVTASSAGLMHNMSLQVIVQ